MVLKRMVFLALRLYIRNYNGLLLISTTVRCMNLPENFYLALNIFGTVSLLWLLTDRQIDIDSS
jgi:hypothetical protein